MNCKNKMNRYQLLISQDPNRRTKKKNYPITNIRSYQKLFLACALISTAFLFIWPQVYNVRNYYSNSIYNFNSESVLRTFQYFSNRIKNSFNEDKEKYKISGCTIPQLDPFDPLILPYMTDKMHINFNCTRKYPLLFITNGSSFLIKVENPEKYGLSKCCYRTLTRLNKDDNSIGLSKRCTEITENSTQISPTHEYISVSCWYNETRKSIFVDILGFVPVKPELQLRLATQKRKSLKDLSSQNNTEINVVILGLDSVSHMNFLRIMPKTHEFITKRLSAIGMNGYNKVGDNTVPNLVPVLTGMNHIMLSKYKSKRNLSFFDKCPFIWKEYAAEGYATGMGEDAPGISIFNYQRKGFQRPPVDYYLRPLTMAQDKFIGHLSISRISICYGPRSSFEVILNFMKQMADTMKTLKQKYFQFLWATALFHDSINSGKSGDEILLKYLQSFKASGYLVNTVFILMSDHGIRYGPFRQTVQGRLEERMPFIYAIVPEVLKQKYPMAIENLRKNSNRLTTPFDVHETLTDLLHLHRIENSELRRRTNDIELGNKEKNIPQGISLFLPIPLSRNCKHARIPEHYCVCDPREDMSTNNPDVISAVNFVISYINKLLIDFPNCSRLRLKRIYMANIILQSTPLVNNKVESFQLEVGFKTKPNDATFEATVTNDGESSWNMSAISRTNEYGNQSSCVMDYNIKMYCYCLS